MQCLMITDIIATEKETEMLRLKLITKSLDFMIGLCLC